MTELHRYVVPSQGSRYILSKEELEAYLIDRYDKNINFDVSVRSSYDLAVIILMNRSTSAISFSFHVRKYLTRSAQYSARLF